MTTEEKHFVLQDLAANAITRLQSLPLAAVKVSGYLMNGRSEDETNRQHLLSVQKRLMQDGHVVFDCLNDDPQIRELGLAWGYEVEEYHRPILQSGLIKTIFFMPEWERSNIARAEHLYGNELGLEIKYVPEEWFEV